MNNKIQKKLCSHFFLKNYNIIRIKMKYLNTFFIIHLYEYFTKLQIGNR